MTNVEFYTKLSSIIEKFKYNRNKKSALALINELNKDAKNSNLDVEADIKIIEELESDINDEMYQESYDDDSYYDSYDDSYDDY